MGTFFLAVGLVLVVEGLAYALAPSLIRRMAELMPRLGDEQLRLFGVAALAIGVGMVYLAQHL